MSTTPFKFLDSYTREDREIFFGREKEIEELYRKVFESKILLVYGISGTGKSSLVHCGLANKFQESDWLPVNVRRGSDFLESMAMALNQVALTPLLMEIQIPQHFRKAVKSVYLDHYKPVFFLFDQFEELFIFGSAQERELFLQVLKILLASDIQCRFIFILREEYLASLSPFEKSIPGFFANRLRIERMSHENASEAIEGPCRVHGIEVEEGFAKKVLEKLCPDENEVELTFLQVYLDRLYRLAQKQQNGTAALRFRESLITEAGSVTDILGNFVDEQIALQSDPETALSVLKAFVSSRGTRQPMSAGEVGDYVLSLGKQVGEQALTSLLSSFVNLRILQDRDQHGKYELRHDALAAKIFEKFTLVEKELLEVRRFVENAMQNFQSRGILLGKDDLNYLDGYGKRLILPTELDDFVQMNRQKYYARQRAFRRLSWISAILFLMMVGGVVRYIIRTQSNDEVNKMINLAVFQSEASPLQSLVTAFKAWDKDTSSVVLSQLIIRNAYRLLYTSADSDEVLQNFRAVFAPVELNSQILHAEISRDGKIIFGWLQDQTVFIYDLTSKNTKSFRVEDEILNIKSSTKETRLSIICKSGKCMVTDWGGILKYIIPVTPNYLMNERLAGFFPEGKYELAAVVGNEAIIVDSTGKTLFVLKGHTAAINAVDISPDGRFVATASSDKQVLLWNFNYHTGTFSPYDTLLGHRDTVWSCEFSSSGLYVLTASADTTVRVWDLNGHDLNPDLYMGLLIGWGVHWKKNSIENDSDRFDPQFTAYYRRNCNATFAMNEFAIIGTDYALSYNKKINHHQYLLFDEYGVIRMQRIYDNMILGLLNGKEILSSLSIKHVVVSSDGRLAAAIPEDDGRIRLLSITGYNFLDINGNLPMFSNDNRIFYWVDGQKINLLPLLPGVFDKLLPVDLPSDSLAIELNWTPL
jgi:hypothetical protein